MPSVQQAESCDSITAAISKRYTLLDFLRGMAVISMVTYHAMWDLVNIFGINLQWYNGTLGFVWQQSICWLFILLSGFCCSLGKSTAKRGLVIFASGVLVTLVTLTVMPENRIIFGILTFIGCAMLITAFSDRIIGKIPSRVGVMVSVLLFALFYNLRDGVVGIGKFILPLPRVLYSNIVGTFFGFMENGFYSADYVPLLPWLFLFLAGYFTFDIIGGRSRLDKIANVYVRPINFIGRHSLVIYLIHQPVIYVILSFIFTGKIF